VQPLACDTCGNRVLVAKYSDIHTSVQWLSDARTSCPEFAALAEQGIPSNLVPGCHALRATIEAAVRDGIVTESRFTEPAPLPAHDR